MNENERALWEFVSPEQKTVFEEELRHIKARYDGQYKLKEAEGTEESKTKVDDSLSQKLVGLAFSGGGIRSATFGLGVLEALKDCDQLDRNKTNNELSKKYIHYLSTVSGGGYIGAWLSANCKRAVKCHIEICVTKSDDKKKKLIQQFKTELLPKNSMHTLLLIAVESDGTKQWTIAGLNKNNEFEEELVNDSKSDLIKELENIQTHLTDKATLDDLNIEQENKDNITSLASSLIEPVQPVSWLNKDAVWKKSIDHLRRNSNYLSPKLGFFSADMWTMATIWLRNTFLIQLLLFLLIACLLIVPRLLFIGLQNISPIWLHSSTIILYILVVVGIATNLLQMTKPESRFLTTDNWWKGFIGALICLLIAYASAADEGYSAFKENSIILLPFYAKVFIALFLVPAGLLLLPTLVMLMNKFSSKEKDKIKQINYTQNYVQVAVVIPMLVASLLFSTILQRLAIINNAQETMTFSEIFFNSWNQWPISILVIFVSLWTLSFFSIRQYEENRHRIRACFVGFFIAPLPSIFTLHVLLSGILFLLNNWGITEHGQWKSFVWAAPLILYALSLTTIIMIGMVGRESSEAVREWWSRYSAWLAIYGFCWMAIVIIAIYGPVLSAILMKHEYWGRGVSFGWIVTTVAGLIVSKSDSASSLTQQNSGAKFGGIIAKIAPFVFVIGLLLVISMVLHYIITVNSDETVLFSVTSLLNEHWSFLSKTKVVVIGGIFGLLVITIGLLAFRIDINEFSLNAFYRSRLVRCYLGATRFRAKERHPQYFTGFDEKDDIKLADLIDSSEQQPPTGPFHIINCALNLGGSRDLSLHTRHSTIFTLTPLRCGSSYKSKDHLGYRGGGEREIGYISTKLFGGIDDQPTLGQAISISGAAASPNMGYNTSPVLAFLMTLFNARLGWWFPNPDKSSITRPSPNFSLFYLLRELLGIANEKSEFLAISDGGHFENLAAYELVKRKCKVIIISDGECDPSLQFEGLGRLIRMCHVDLGAKISIDVDDIQINKDSGWSQKRYAIGKIEYAKNSKQDSPDEGWLIYLKASMNGDEDTAIKQYKATHLTFPHETTGDQFYGEDQFESYRKLGYDIASKVFSNTDVASKEDFTSMAEELEKQNHPQEEATKVE